MMMRGELSIKQNRMNGISVPKIACLHHTDDHIITENYEIVCKKCGVVLGTDNSQEIATESTLNLFHEIEPGTKPVKIDCTKRTHEHRSDTSLFSNACDKLDLPRYCYLEAWNTYTKLRNNTTYSKADIASFALFTASRRYSIPKSEQEIQDAIRMAFRVKRVPTMLKVFSRIKLTAENLGINYSNDERESESYYLNLYLAREQQKLGLMVDFELVRKRARVLFEAMSGTNEAKARKAVQIAMGRCGGGFL
jgi:transcription initiation factor TFIIIB Brf1 subunit/transcription initiation factor TFIIB